MLLTKESSKIDEASSSIEPYLYYSFVYISDKLIIMCASYVSLYVNGDFLAI